MLTSVALLSAIAIEVVANGGNIRIAEGKYLVNVSSSPITPVAGEAVAMLIAFADVAHNEPIRENLRVSIEIRKKATGEVVFPEQTFVAENGILEFTYTYREPVLHELFIRFEKPDEPGKIYEPEDFLVDVRPKQSAATAPHRLGFALVAMGLAFLFGLLIGRRVALRRSPLTAIGHSVHKGEV